MNYEVIPVSLKIKDKIIIGKIKLFEENPMKTEFVLLILSFLNVNIEKSAENFFEALQLLRKDLEKQDIQIMCNGAAENVYPSTMQLSMGSGRKAYLTKIGCTARLIDIIDIFEKDSNLNFVTIERQNQFHDDWVKSILNK